MKIQDFINSRHKYKVDPTYQRPPDAWSRQDKQCLIDTIIRSEPIPIFFLNHVSEEDVYYIVDGQQRLGAIKDFYDNKFPLSQKFSEADNDGRTFNGENAISDEVRENFLNYKLSFRMLADYDDERIRMVFSRLQRGKPLQLGERLNAKPGEIVKCMREIASHPFMSRSIGVSKQRYGNYPDAARILFYEKYKARQMGSEELYAFFDESQNMMKTDRDYQNAIRVLDFLAKCFPPQPGDYAHISKHAWVLAVYTLARELLLRYSVQNSQSKIAKFVKSFHGKVYTESWRSSVPDIQRFYDNIRGGWSEKIIRLRTDILLKHCLEEVKPLELDDNRQISDEDKISVYEIRNERCERCQVAFKDHCEPEYHHVQRYADGGATAIDNIEMLCVECHKKAHGKGTIKSEMSPEEELDYEG